MDFTNKNASVISWVLRNYSVLLHVTERVRRGFAHERPRGWREGGRRLPTQAVSLSVGREESMFGRGQKSRFVSMPISPFGQEPRFLSQVTAQPTSSAPPFLDLRAELSPRKRTSFAQSSSRSSIQRLASSSADLEPKVRFKMNKMNPYRRIEF